MIPATAVRVGESRTGEGGGVQERRERQRLVAVAVGAAVCLALAVLAIGVFLAVAVLVTFPAFVHNADAVGGVGVIFQLPIPRLAVTVAAAQVARAPIKTLARRFIAVVAPLLTLPVLVARVTLLAGVATFQVRAWK